MTGPSYVYRATVLSVHDGDGLTLSVDVGFFIHVVVPFRIAGINARELSQPGGPEARDHLAALLPAGTEVTVQSIKPDKFGGRWDCAITYAFGDLAATLTTTQWADPWDGTGTKPVPPWPRTVTVSF